MLTFYNFALCRTSSAVAAAAFAGALAPSSERCVGVLFECGALGDGVPQPAAKPLVRLRALHKAIAQGVVAAVHDCSEGGVAVAVAEMCVGGRLGADIDLSALPVSERAGLDAHVAAFSESNGRFVVEVAPGRAAELEALLTDVAHAPIGTACEAARLRLHYGGQACGETSIDDLARAFLPAS